jgi:hypothetical protein
MHNLKTLKKDGFALAAKFLLGYAKVFRRNQRYKPFVI